MSTGFRRWPRAHRNHLVADARKHIKAVPYVPIRLSHLNLLNPLTRMEQPFSVLLLCKGIPRMISESCFVFRIISRPTDPPGALKGEVNTLTIV